MIPTTAIGRMIWPTHADRIAGLLMMAAAAHTSDSELHTARNEMPWTPVNDAIWINGTIRYCETPSKSHGNPPNNRARIMSSPTHSVAPNTHHAARCDQASDMNCAAQYGTGRSFCASASRARKHFQHSHTHVAIYKDKNAASAIHPSTFAQIQTGGTGISNSQ